MTLSNPKPLGWAYGEVLTSTQMNSFGTQLPDAVDGNAGGTYAPSGQVILNGSGLRVGGTGLSLAAVPTTDALSFTGLMRLNPSYTSGWAVDAANEYLVQTAVTGAEAFTIQFFPPIGSTLTGVTLYLEGDAGGTNHGGTLPASVVRFRTRKRPLSAWGSPVDIHSNVLDPSANATAYDAAHTITSGVLSETVVDTHVYQILVTGESGAGAQADSTGIFAATYTYTTTSLRPHFG